MELYTVYTEKETVVIELWKDKTNGSYGCTAWDKTMLNWVGDTLDATTLCIIYPKGKRPDLGYSVNNKIEEK